MRTHTASRPHRAKLKLVTNSAAEDLAAQHQYVEEMGDSPVDLTIFIANAFVEGIRQVGYRSVVTALNELIDNAIQASATKVAVYVLTKGDYVDKLVVIDNGHGMEPQMIRLAVCWGGSHRSHFNDRSGFGRFGFGLPSASISQGRKYSVISMLPNKSFYRVTIDLDAMARGEYLTKERRNEVPLAQKYSPEPWLRELLELSPLSRSGTIVVWENFDRIRPKKAVKLREQLVSQFGVYYRNCLRETEIDVDGTRVEPIDPLFQQQTARYFALDADRAEPLPSLDVPIKRGEEVVGTIHVRMSYFPPTFGHVDKERAKSPENARWKIIREFNDGILVLRNHRQIDTVRVPWRLPIHRDFSWAVEIDFPPALDEEFSVATTKQHVVIQDGIWQALDAAGVRKAIAHMLHRTLKDRSALRDQQSAKKVAEDALKAAVATTDRSSLTLSEARLTEGQKKFEAEVSRRASAAGIDAATVRAALEREIHDRPFAIEFADETENPFYRPEMLGGQRRVIINRDHPFYTALYGVDGMPQGYRIAFDTILLVLAKAELEAPARLFEFYIQERGEWSRILRAAITNLDKDLLTDLTPTRVENEDVMTEEAS